MSGTESMVVGNKGRVVIPASIRTKHHWHEGTVLLAVESDSGVVLVDRAEVERMLRLQLAGFDVVESLVMERREAAEQEES